VVRMRDFDVVAAEDVRLMQGLAQRVTAVRPDLVNSDATFGELAWITGAYLGYQVHPDQAELVDDVIGWYDRIAVNLERTVMPRMADEFALKRWEEHGYQADPASLGEAGSWTQLNERDAGATHMTVACLGAPGHPKARGLYYGVGFRPFTRDAPLIKPAV
jgi:hypothetical protein